MSKTRPLSHITGDEAIDIVKSILPKEWVCRNLTPDYGLDLLIELFGCIDSEKQSYETLGEFLFVQVKGTQHLEKRKIKVHPVYNVAKQKWQENKEEFIEIETTSYQLDIQLIETVRAIGTSVSVLLFVVDTTNKKLYFICLNDYIDKYLIPKNPNYKNQKTVTIIIPLDNYIDNTFNGLVPLRLYSKRSKLYSAFTLFRYQLKELKREISMPEIAFLSGFPTEGKELEHITKELSEYIMFFANQLLDLDIWNIGDNLFALGLAKNRLDKLINQIKDAKINDYHILVSLALGLWEQLDNLSSIYEEVCREWFLPKFIGQLGSYDNQPDVKKKFA
jgi:hypothetical protein